MSHPLYDCWNNMKRRCCDPRDKQYPNYGGRGIKISEAWQDYQTFFQDMHPKPAGKTLERINNDQGYSKENCCWATPQEQRLNQRMKPTSSGITGVHWNTRLHRWYAYTSKPQQTLYSGLDFFEACCARKSWEAAQ
jgi:hypothetical protein